MPTKTFAIEVDSPDGGTFLPGSNITGKVHLAVHESKTYKSVRVTLRGCAEVNWRDGDQNRGDRYQAREDFVTLNDTVWERSSGEGGRLPAGTYRWPFSILLTGAKLPPSFIGSFGKIQYALEARIVQDSLFKKETKVEAILDVGAERVPIDEPEMVQPLALETQTKVSGLLCCSAGSVNITASIPRTGYCVREDSIPLEVQAENGSSRRIQHLQACLKQKVTYRGHHQTGLIRTDTKTRAENNVLVSVRSDPVPTRYTEYWNPAPIGIPHTYVSVTDCPLISITYLLEVTAIGTGARIELPIILGNVAPSARQLQSPHSYDPLAPNADLAAYQPPVAGIHNGLPHVSVIEPLPPALNWPDAVPQPYPYVPEHYPSGPPQ